MNIFGLEIRRKGKAGSPAPQGAAPFTGLVYRPSMSVGELMGNGTVNACVNIISDAVASMPLDVYKRLSNGDRRKAGNLPVCALLKLRTNFYQLPFSFKKQMMSHLLLKGNAFIYIERTAGDVTALYLLDPGRVEIKKFEGRNEYYFLYTDENSRAWKYTSDEVIHIPAFVWNGVRGMSPIEYASRVPQLGNSLDEYTGVSFNGGIHSKLLVTVPKEERNWGKDESEALSKRLSAAYGGIENASRPLILSKGLTAQPLNLASNSDGQLVENRQYTVKEIAKIFRVPLSMLGESDAKYNNNEQQARNFLTNTLQPWLILIEQSFAQLLPYPDRGTYYFEFDRESMVQSDTKTKIELMVKELNNGLLTLNETRRMLNLPEFDSEIGDKPLAAVNMSFLENSLKKGGGVSEAGGQDGAE